VINAVIREGVDEKVKEAVRVLNPVSELVLSSDPEQRRKYLQNPILKHSITFFGIVLV
jgi:hypothetical protein